jgi:regulator of sigma E protease
MKANQFTLGFGPTLFSFRRASATFLFKAIPLGASARIRGMNPHEPNLDPGDRSSFAANAGWKRALVIAAGSATNALLALVALVGLHVAGTHVPVPMTVGSVTPGWEAARAQLKLGDRIETLNGEPIERWSTLVHAVADNPGKVLRLGIDRRGQHIAVSVTPQMDENGNGRLGITQQWVFRRQHLGDALRSALGYMHYLGAEGLSLLNRFIHGKRSTDMMRQILETTPRSLDALLRGLAGLSLVLSLFFLIPLPGLDGGRLLFLALEAVLRRPLHPKLETTLHALGFLALLAFLLAIPVRELIAILQSVKTPVAAGSEDLDEPDAGVSKLTGIAADGGSTSLSSRRPPPP